MAQYEMSLRDYRRIILKRMTGILVFIILGAAVTFLFVQGPKKRYRAVSKIRVARPVSRTQKLIDILSNTDTGNDIATHAKRIVGQKTLIAVAYSLNMLPDFVQAKDVETVIRDDFDKRRVARTVIQLRKKIKVEREDDTNILSITVEDSTEEGAQQLANAIATVYVQRVEVESKRYLEDLKAYVTKKLMEARDDLVRAQKNLQNKRREALGEGMTQEYSSLAIRRSDAEQTRKHLARQIEMLKKWREAEKGAIISASAGKASNSVIEGLNKQLVDLQLKRHDLLVYHTERAPQVKDVDSRIANVVRRIIQEMEAIDERLKAEITAIDKTLKDSPAYEMELNKAKAQVEAATLAVRKWQDAVSDAEIRSREQARIVDIEERAASAIVVKQAPKGLLIVVGGIVGLIFGFLYAVIMEVLDTSIDTIDDVEELLGTHVRGVIPHVDMRELRALIRETNPDLAEDQLPDRPVLFATQLGPKSASAEAFRTLRTNLEFEIAKRGGNALAIASAALGEGKTSTACNLAVAFAQNGKKTILVGGDLRRPSVYRAFGLEKQPGLSEVLQGRQAVQEAVRTVSDMMLGDMSTENVLRTPGLENLHILTCGGSPANPAELLSHEQTRQIMEELKGEYDVVLVDCPPVLPVADAVIMSTYVDGVLLVYQVGKIARGVLKRAKQQLDNVGASVWGVVLNDLTPEVSEFRDAHYYRQDSYYMTEETGKRGGLLSRMLGRGA